MIPHVILFDRLGRSAVLCLRLDEHLPLPAKTVELIHVQSTQGRLQRLIDIAKLHPFLQGLIAVDIRIHLRSRGRKLAN